MSTTSDISSVVGETSPRKRQRNHDGVGLAEELKIEEYLYSIDAYRVTTAPFPLPYPLKLESAPRDLTDQFRANWHAIREMLHEQGFHDNWELFPVNLSKPGYLAGHPPRPTVMAHVKGPCSRLAPFRDHLNRFLVAKGIFADVEVVDVDNCYQPGFFAIPPSHPAVEVYEKIRPQLLKQLRTQIPFEWTSLTLALLGRELYAASPSIVVTVNQQSSHNWFDLLAWVRALVSRNSPSGLAINVDFIPGRFDSSPKHFTPSQGENEVLGKHQFKSCGADGLFPLGLSIGESGQSRAGTMGGLVNFTLNGQTYKCGITNHHVIQPTVSGNEVDSRANQFGVPISQTDKLSTRMEVFASNDVAATVLFVDEEVAEVETTVAGLEETALRAELKHGKVPETLQVVLESTRENLACLTKVRALLSQLPLPLGNVLCSSGQGVWEGRLQDWALIELSNEALALMEPTVDMDRVWRMIDRSPPSPALVAARAAEQVIFPEKRFGQIVPGKWYTRTGRTSVVSGIANGVHVCMNWTANDMIRYDLSGSAVTMEHSETEEHLIIAQTEQSMPMSQMFGLPGDSGSLLLDQHGTICGLYYGNVTRWAEADGWVKGNAGLAMSMDDVEKGMKSRLGSDIVLSPAY